MTTHYSKHAGNVLFLILIAVALFAALSYAVTRSSRSGGSADREKIHLQISELLQFGAQIEQAMQRLVIINGCPVSQISFESAPFDGSDTDYVNASAPVDFSCHIFHPNGGGVAEINPDFVLSLSYDSAFPVSELGTTCASSICSEIRAVFRLSSASSTANEYEAARQFCERYNEETHSTASLSDNIQDDTDLAP